MNTATSTYRRTDTAHYYPYGEPWSQPTGQPYDDWESVYKEAHNLSTRQSVLLDIMQIVKFMKNKMIIRLFQLSLVLMLALGSVDTYANGESSRVKAYKYCSVVDSYDYLRPNDSSIPSDYNVSIVKISAPVDKGLLIYFGKLYGNSSSINMIFESEMVISNPHPGSPYQLAVLLTYIDPGKSKTVVFQTKKSGIESILNKLYFHEFKYSVGDIESFFPLVSELNISSDIIVIPYLE